MNSILIIDDDPGIKKMLNRRLRKAGYRISTAENGEEGVHMALDLKPDLILLDMHMPVMDGYTAARRLREKGYKGFISALTASAMVEETNKAIGAGCDTFITKPIGPDFEDIISGLVQKISGKD